MTTPPVVITYPVESAIVGDDTSTPDTALSYITMADYSTAVTGVALTMQDDAAVLDTNPSVDTDNLIAGDDTPTPDTGLAYFASLANADVATMHRSHGGGDYFGNPKCDQKRVGSLGSA